MAGRRQETDRCRPPDQALPAKAQWAEDFAGRLSPLFAEHGISMKLCDPLSMVFQAVPVGEGWNKPRTNLLLRRTAMAVAGGMDVYFDIDLVFQGKNPLMDRVNLSPSRGQWRRWPMPPRGGSVGEVFTAALRFLQSPIAEEVASVLEVDAAEPSRHDPELPPLLASVAEPVARETAEAAYASTFHRDLVDQVAALLARNSGSRGMAVWSAGSGAGKDHLMLACAHPILENGLVSRALRIPMAWVAAGSYFKSDLDAGLMRLFREASTLDAPLLLLQDLDVCLSGSAISYSLLCDAADRGVRFLATFRSLSELAAAGRDAGLRRRMMAVRVPRPGREQVAEVLNNLASASGMEVVPEAIEAVLNVDSKPGVDPGASLGLLGTAMCRAAWRCEGAQLVTPDDVLHVERLNDWPLDNE